MKITKEGNFIQFKTEKGVLNCVVANDFDGIGNISDMCIQNSDISENKIEIIANYFTEKGLMVGFLSSIEVNEGFRGQGVGRELMDQFKEKIMSNTDVDLLYARSNNEQAAGFIIEDFYEKYGFRSILLEDGDILMLSKGYDLVFEEILGLKEEREMIAGFFNKNAPQNKNQLDVLSFVKRKMAESKNKFKKP